MNRRSFLWQSFCSSLPFFAQAGVPQQIVALEAPTPGDAALTTFTRGLTGTVFRPGDPKYDGLRKGYAAKYDAHPLLIVRPANSQDIQSTLSFVRSNRLPLAIRCGGHSYAAFSTCESGLVLDMSGFRTITIAPDKSHARLGGGMLCGSVEIETAKSSVAPVLGQCPSVGVGGFLLGGGISPLMSKYGLGCDNVLAAELVLADGRQINVSANENPDLYWAIRGGGGNFGIVTTFEVALHPVSKVLAGFITLESADPRVFLRAFREFLPSVPDELTLISRMSAEPNHKPKLDIQICYVGDEAEGEKVLVPLRHHPAVIHDNVKWRPYLELEQMVPADLPPSYEEHYGGFFTELDDRKIDLLASAFTNAPFPVDSFLIDLHGAVTRVPLTATAFPLRSKGIACDVTAYWQPPGGQQAAKDWIEALKAKLPMDAGGNYVNTMDREGESSVRRVYGANYARLQHLKARYDPNNLFSLNQNIQPA